MQGFFWFELVRPEGGKALQKVQKKNKFCIQLAK